MAKFHVGQQVTAIRSRNADEGKERLGVGSKYIVNDVRTWKCGCKTRTLLDVGVREDQVQTLCKVCDKNPFFDDVVWFGEHCFAQEEEEQFKAVNLEESITQIPISAN